MVDSERPSHAGRRSQRQHGSVRYPKVAEKAKRVSLRCEEARGHLAAKRADECEDVLFRPSEVCERKLVKHGQRVLRVDAASLRLSALSRGYPDSGRPWRPTLLSYIVQIHVPQSIFRLRKSQGCIPKSLETPDATRLPQNKVEKQGGLFASCSVPSTREHPHARPCCCFPSGGFQEGFFALE